MKSRSFPWQKIIQIFFKIISWVLFVILLLVAIFLLYYYIANKIYVSKGAGYEPKFSIYTIATGSMTPNINQFDAVINMRIDDPKDLKVGDVITFRSSSPTSIGMTITHRIKAITEDTDGNVCYVTKGDANPVADELCAKYNNVIGKVIIRIPGLGHIQRFLASGVGWLLFILIPAIIIIGRGILRLTKLSSIKETANRMNTKKKDPKKEENEKKRKNEIKRKLLNENNGPKEYYKEPIVKVVEKNRNKTESNQKRKKK